MLFDAGKNVVEIYAFQGNGRLRNLGEPLTLTGHVGLSLDGKRIYGFGPIIPKDINFREARNQLKKSAFAGQLSDDTNFFKKVACGFYNRGQIELDLYKLTVPINEQTYLNIIEEIRTGGIGAFYKFPEKGDKNFPPNTYNCATFWEKCGVQLPHQSGFLEEYIPAMVRQGAERVKK